MSDTLTATGTLIANFAWQHLKAATLFRDQVMRLEAENSREPFGAFFEDIRSYASACILSTAASLEAFINEEFITPNGKLRPSFKEFEKEFWGKGGIERKPILCKYKIALSRLDAPPFVNEASPYRDVWALIELRNALVHYKPIWDPDRQPQVDLFSELKGKFRTSPFLDHEAGADFISMKCMSGGCCAWTVATAIAFLKEFDRRAKLDAKKMSAFWKLGAA